MAFSVVISEADRRPTKETSKKTNIEKVPAQDFLKILSGGEIMDGKSDA